MKYGDYESVSKDAKTIYEIIERQGDAILFECIAEKIANACQKFNLSDKEKCELISKKIAELKEEILERI